MFSILIFLTSFANASPLYPDSKMTPGLVDPRVTQENIQTTICRVGYTRDVRHVSVKTKRLVFKEYDLDYDEQAKDFEVDHFVSLELGGLNDITNLWPQRWTPAPGARQKDVVETGLKRMICKGAITLIEAQAIIKDDWIACYDKIKARQICHEKDR